MITEHGIAVFPILADVVKVKKGSGSTAHWSINFIRLSGWLRRCFTLLITPLDIDGIGQNWEDSNRIDTRGGMGVGLWGGLGGGGGGGGGGLGGVGAGAQFCIVGGSSIWTHNSLTTC